MGLVINEAMSFGLPIVTTENCLAGLELILDKVNILIVPVENDDGVGKLIWKI